MKYGFSKDQLQEIVEVLAEYPEIESAVLFGSRAMDSFKAGSDVDIAIKGEKVNTSLALKVTGHFEDTNTPFFFDIIAWPTISSKELREHIQRVGEVIYCRK